uniref:Uncharacterized protein n=1 Tax=Trichogramma kaykai TaxID=54128 RepID=A0ABD2XL24_9HYME
MPKSEVESDASFVRQSDEFDESDESNESNESSESNENNDNSESSENDASSGNDSVNMDVLDEANVEKLISLRENIDWQTEADRHKLLDQFYDLIKEWGGQLPDLSEIFKPGEIDWLLVLDVFNETESPLVDFVIRTGYKDEPQTCEDGKTIFRRTTAVHRAARSSRPKVRKNIPKLFEIYKNVNYIDESGLTHFHVACKYGFKDVVKKFLELRQDPNCLNQKFVDPPLHLALKHQHEDVAELLLRSGADANLANKDGLTPLHIIICHSYDDDSVNSFFEINDDIGQKVRIDARDKLGRTPLHFALNRYRETVAKWLLVSGANPNLADEDGSTPLHTICKRGGDGDLVKTFFNTSKWANRPVEVDARDKLGRTPLQWAVANLLSDVVDVLLENGADLSNFDFPNENYFADRFTLECTLQVVVFPAMSIIGSLESKGYRLDQTAALTVMKTFAKHGLIDESVNVVECLRSDEDFSSIAKDQLVSQSISLYDFLHLPLEEAEKLFTVKHYEEFTSEISNIDYRSHRAYMKYLCKTITRGFFRRWALELFSKKNSWLSKRYCEMFISQLKIKALWDISMEAANESTQWLDSMRTDFIKKYYNRDLSLSYSFIDDITDTMDYLKKLIILREEINWEVEDERRELLDQLELLLRNWKGQFADLRPFFRPEEIDGLLVRLVFNEIYSSEVPLIDLVIRTGYKDSPKVDEDSEPHLLRTTPVHLAARRCSFKMQFIIPKLFQIYDRFDLRYIDQSGLTHFHVACQYGCEDIVGKFIELGQDVDCLEQRSDSSAVDSPLHLALANGHKNVAQMLLRKGAKMNLTNKDGWSPLHIICNNEDSLGLAEMIFKISTDIHQPIQINARDSKGQTPLHFATKQENLDMIGFLLRNGADPNSADAKGSTPLHFICMRNDNDDMGKRFFKMNDDIQKTVQVDAKDELGRTPLQLAVASLLPDLVDTLLIRGADVSSFIFPTEDYFGENYTLECSLKMIVFSTTFIVKSLESKGYEVDQTAALTMMKIFAKYGLIDESSVNLDECFRTDQEFVRIAKKQLVSSNLSLYDFLQLPPEEAEKIFTLEDYKKFTSGISDFCDNSHRAFTRKLCETVTYAFFRQWAMKLFLKKNSWLSKHYCEMFIKQLKIKALWEICMQAVNESTQWVDFMFTSDDESDLSFFVPSDDCDSKDMHQVDKDNLKKFKGIRDKFNQKIEEERHELLDQLESLIRNWKGQLTDLRPFLQREEIDRLLIKFMKDSYSIFSSIYIIELVIRTGYKDEPELDKDGVPLSRRTTPLHQAARRRCFYVVDRLFKIYNRYDVNYTDESGLTHFHVACRYGCNGVVRKFLELGQTPNCLARESVDPPLHLAMRNFDKETMELLLRSGADANLINKDGLTPLHIICKSVERYDDKLAKLFFEVNEKVDQTVQVHARDKLGRTPLQWAVANLMSDAVDTLLDHVDDLSDFVFPKDLAMKYTLDCTLQMVVFPTMSIVKSLSRKGYSLNQNDALMIMKIFGNYGLIDDSVEVVECLRNDKKFARMAKKQLVTSSMSLFDVNYIDESGLTHFHVACQRHCNDVVKKFLELGLNPNCPEQTSDTSTVDSPLHLSLAWANEVAVELLLRNGADPNMTNSEGSTPSHVIGHEYFNDEVAELFFKINDELHQAVHINSRDKKGQTPLHLASRSGNQKGTELLLRKGANPNWADSNGSTPLHVICETDYDSLEHVQKFFEICDEQHQPVQVDAQDRLGRTPLHVALARDKQKVAELLLTRGADRNLATKDGSTPLHIICKRDKDDYDLAKMFFEIADDDQRLVNVDAVDNLGRTPLQWAVANLLSDVVDLLLDYVADLSNFAFPTEDYFAETYTLDCSTLPKVVFRTMYILEWLEGKGYSPDQTAALTVMKTFAKHGLIDEPVDIDECLRSDEEFAKIAKNRMVSPSLSLYDFLQLPPKEAEKVFAIDDYEEFTFDILHLCDESHKAYIRYLCETVTRGFFRRAALKFFSEKNSWLPQSCFENVIGELKIKALWDICMEASNEDTRWLASICDELCQPVQVNARDKKGRTPLHLSISKGNEKLTRFLLKKGADLELVTDDGLNPLHIVCKSDDIFLHYREEMVSLIFEVNNDKNQLVNAVDKLGRTPLQWAVANFLSVIVDVILDHGADLSNFVFPTEDYFAQRHKLEYTLGMVVFPTMSIVESLKKKGYILDQNAALMIMKFFAENGLIDESVDISECLLKDEELVSFAKKQIVSQSMSIYDFLQLPPEKAEKFFTLENYLEFTYRISHLPDESHRAYVKYLCETVSRGFFRDWALKLFSEKTCSWLPKPYCEMLIMQLKIKGLWNICMVSVGENTQWLDSVRTDYMKKHYIKKGTLY